MIEAAYLTGEAMGLEAWGTDPAGPYQTTPDAGRSWRPVGDPARQPHEDLREGTAQALTLSRPAECASPAVGRLGGLLPVPGPTACGLMATDMPSDPPRMVSLPGDAA
ncbi:MAG TPA: hypothetical protein VG406_19025 [Isosphaeraceae bacterium]|nr:hypothetical protein [Isosphaeraceae bacterium]